MKLNDNADTKGAYRSFVTLMRANPETLLGLGFLLKAYKSRNVLENLVVRQRMVGRVK